MNINWVALIILIVLLGIVTVMGFQAARWRRPENLASLYEWGLGGKSFGNITTWFLLGGDLYTAYTFIAVPAAMFATGAVAGFFAVRHRRGVRLLHRLHHPAVRQLASRRTRPG